MNFEVRLTSTAELQLTESFSWYEQLYRGLGEKFEEDVRAKINQVVENPLKFQLRFDQIRLAHLSIFPYSIHYRVHQNEILIIAVMHQHARRER